MWILWYLLICLVLEKPPAILWGDLWQWGYACCLTWKFHILWPSQWLFYWKVVAVSLSFVQGKPEPLLFPCNRVCSELCIFWYPYSCLSSSIDILLDSMYEWLPGDQVCHVLPQVLCISMLQVWQEPRLFGLNPWHVCRVILSHVRRDQLHVWVLFHWIRCLEMHLKKGSVFCICSSACNLSVVSGFGVVLGVSMTSGVTASDCGYVVGSSVVVHWAVLLLVLNAGPSRLVADSIWTVAGLSCSNSTSHERQLAALCQAPDIHSKVML